MAVHDNKEIKAISARGGLKPCLSKALNACPLIFLWQIRIGP